MNNLQVFIMHSLGQSLESQKERKNIESGESSEVEVVLQSVAVNFPSVLEIIV